MLHDPAALNQLIDLRLLLCPEPLMLLRVHLKKAKPGEILHVLADDPLFSRDLLAFCKFIGHLFLKQEQCGTIQHYWIRKKLETHLLLP